MAGMEALLWQLAQKQAQQQNSSPFSQFVNDAGAEAGGKLNAAGQSIVQAIMAPGNALRGEYDEREISPDGSVSQFDPRMMDDATNLAGSIGLSSMPIPKPSGALAMGFADWFGQSKAANPDGSPMRLYHGTGGNFDEFDLAKANAVSGGRDVGFHFGTVEQANQRAGMAADGGNVMPVHLSLKNPARLPDLGYWSPSNVASELYTRKLISYDDYVAVADGKKPIGSVMKDNGFDGIVYNNAVEGAGDSFIAMEPTQVKSAIGNSGAFSALDPNITRSAGFPVLPSETKEQPR